MYKLLSKKLFAAFLKTIFIDIYTVVVHLEATAFNTDSDFSLKVSLAAHHLKVSKCQKRCFLKPHCPKNQIRKLDKILPCKAIYFLRIWAMGLQEKLLLRFTDL